MKTKKLTKKIAMPAKTAAAKKITVNKVAVKKSALKAPVAKKAAPKKATKKIVVKKAAPQKVTVKKAVAKKTAPNKVTALKNNSSSLNTPIHIIPKTEGQAMVTNFRNSMLDLNSATTVQFSDGREFHKSLFEKLLLLDGVEKIRFYNAVDENNQHTLVITAVDSNRNDIYFKNEQMISKQGTSQRSVTAPDTDGVGDMGSQCPAYQPNVTAL